MVDNKPVQNISVSRWYKWGFYGTEKTETVSTDTAWYFSFPTVAMKSVLTWIIPHEAVITQRVFIPYNNEKVDIYGTVKRNYDMNGEYWGKALEFVFDPTQDVEHKTFAPYPEMPDFTLSISIRPAR